MEKSRLTIHASYDDIFFSTIYHANGRLYVGFEAQLKKIDDGRARLRLFNIIKYLKAFDTLEVFCQYEEKEVLNILQKEDVSSKFLLLQIEEHLYGMGYRGKVILECADGPLEFVNVVKSPLDHVVKIEKKKQPQ